jgi:hypothetical protein
LGDEKEAISKYTQAIALDDKSAYYYMNRAIQPIFQHLSHSQNQPTLQLSNFQNIILLSSNNKTIPNSANEDTHKKSSSLANG